jgi:hypothetical protein
MFVAVTFQSMMEIYLSVGEYMISLYLAEYLSKHKMRLTDPVLIAFGIYSQTFQISESLKSGGSNFFDQISNPIYHSAES